MKINIRAKNQVKMSPAVQEYIESKVGDLEKLFNRSEVVTANVLCKGHEKYTVVEITIPLKHLILRAESKGDTLFMAIDLAVDKIERQLLKHKRKVNTMIKKREGIANYFSGLEEAPEKEEALQVKNKEVELTEMSQEEAITQMELLDHDFFLYIDEKTHKQTLVYVRHDGGYGVIEPK